MKQDKTTECAAPVAAETPPTVTPQQENHDTDAAEQLPQQPAAGSDAAVTSVESVPPDTPGASDTDRLIAEAEQRGYLRGLNEAVERQMSQPTLFEDLARRRAQSMAGAARPDRESTDRSSGFLSRISRSVWD